jgi:hypothetical protein
LSGFQSYLFETLEEFLLAIDRGLFDAGINLNDLGPRDVAGILEIDRDDDVASCLSS